MPAARAGTPGGIADYPVDLSTSDMGVLNFNGMGGGTILYNAVWPRLLRMNSIASAASASARTGHSIMPRSPPFHDEVDRQIGISGMAGDPRYPPGDGPPLPPHPLGRVRAHRPRLPCTRLALVAGAERSAFRALWRPARLRPARDMWNGVQRGREEHHRRDPLAAVGAQRGGRVITGARVTRVTLDSQGLANGALWRDARGTEHFQPARIVLMAANGIGTPRLLLASACERFPAGLANSSGQLRRAT